MSACNRRIPFGLPLILCVAPGLAAAQMGVDEGVVSEEFAVEDSSGGREPRAQPASLEEAMASGRSIVLGGRDYVRPAVVPDLYAVEQGDTLWDITGRFFGNPYEWPRLWSYNPEITNPHWIYPRDQVRLRSGATAGVAVPTATPTRGNSLVPSVRHRDPQSVFLREEGYLDPQALTQTGLVVGSPGERMLMSNYDEVYLQFDSNEGIERGMELTIFRPIESNERNAEEQGQLVRIFGTVELRSYDPERRFGRGIITETLDPIERGYQVASIPRRFELVSPRQNEVDVEAHVIASLRQHNLLSEHLLVFLNVGSQQQVQAGNRFFIVRQGDDWRDSLSLSEERTGAHYPDSPSPGSYPEEIVAEGRVVHVRPTTCALMITASVEEIEFGDRAEMRRGY